MTLIIIYKLCKILGTFCPLLLCLRPHREMATLRSPSQSATVLGKRKITSDLSDPLVLHLGSPPHPQPSVSFFVPVNNGRVPDPQRPYACSFEGCGKTYKKPSRLAEHERSHTGVVSALSYLRISSPFIELSETVRLCDM